VDKFVSRRRFHFPTKTFIELLLSKRNTLKFNKWRKADEDINVAFGRDRVVLFNETKKKDFELKGGVKVDIEEIRELSEDIEEKEADLKEKQADLDDEYDELSEAEIDEREEEIDELTDEIEELSEELTDAIDDKIEELEELAPSLD